jgi:phosphoglycerol geranylgeranyltransferase
MKAQELYQHIIRESRESKKMLAILIDPDKQEPADLKEILGNIEGFADLILVGGSLMVTSRFDTTINAIKQYSNLPVIIFPGSPQQISPHADGILLLSLISGRNPELLIGQHVIAAPKLKESGIEILPTGYMLVESGSQTTASYISQTMPLPSNKPEIAACTALAGEQLGLKLIYLDGGSGAKYPVSKEIIHAVKSTIKIPLIIGGGIRTAAQAEEACNAGADIIVIGTAFEEDKSLIHSIAAAIKKAGAIV